MYEITVFLLAVPLQLFEHLLGTCLQRTICMSGNLRLDRIQMVCIRFVIWPVATFRPDSQFSIYFAARFAS